MLSKLATLLSPRASGRMPNHLRDVAFIPSYLKHGEGSCMVKFGDTHVLCTASVDEKVPPFLRNTGSGWVTAEYGMLPRATHQRTDREATKGKQQGRTQEIQRLIGRSLRAVTDLKKLGERQIKLDCDVIQADGGTRTAAICGAYVALHMACDHLLKKNLIKTMPLRTQVAAVSCGILDGVTLLDLEYTEDSVAGTDANFVMAGSGELIEVQATAEGAFFSDEQLMGMLKLAREGASHIMALQRQALKID